MQKERRPPRKRKEQRLFEVEGTKSCRPAFCATKRAILRAFPNKTRRSPEQRATKPVSERRAAHTRKRRSRRARTQLHRKHASRLSAASAKSLSAASTGWEALSAATGQTTLRPIAEGWPRYWESAQERQRQEDPPERPSPLADLCPITRTMQRIVLCGGADNTP